MTFADSYFQKCHQLMNENSKLRRRIMQLELEMGDLGTAHAKEINKIEDEFYEEILKLEKENKQLKRELDQFYLLIGRGDWSGLVDLIKGDVE